MHENAMQLKQKALKIHPLLGQNWGFKLLIWTLPTTPGAHLSGHSKKPLVVQAANGEFRRQSRASAKVTLWKGEALLRANAAKTAHVYKATVGTAGQ